MTLESILRDPEVQKRLKEMMPFKLEKNHSAKGKRGLPGIPKTFVQRMRMSEARKGRKFPKQAESLKLAHRDPEIRKRLLDGLRSPESRAKMSAAAKKRWTYKGYRAKMARRGKDRKQCSNSASVVA